MRIPMTTFMHDAKGLPAHRSPGAPSDLRRRYLQALQLAFALFNTTRVLCYLPTIWAIWQSGDSSQHSLWTWGTWFGANLTMAAWLYEDKGRQWTRAAVVSLGNAGMCAATLALIVGVRCA